MSEKFISHPCDVCLTDKPIEINIASKYTNNQKLYTCSNCGFVYVKDRRSAKDIADSWSNELFQNAYTAKIPYVLGRQTYVADYINETVGLKDKSICDIGAGEGQFLKICKEKENTGAIQFYGIEPSSKNIDLLQKQEFETFHGTIEDFDASGNQRNKKFDLVTIMWTLETCFDCNKMLSVSWDMLKENGYVVIATGSRLLVPYKKPLDYYLSKNPSDTHSFRFSANSLQNILRKHGFSIAHVNRYIDGDFLVMIAKKSEKNSDVELKKDNPDTIIEFFNRWDSETEWFKKVA